MAHAQSTRTASFSTAAGEWPSHTGDTRGTRYSPLDQITAANFGSLKLAWRAKSPDGFLSLTLADGSEWSADSKPRGASKPISSARAPRSSWKARR